MARHYNTFADFTREEIRPGLRIGWSLEDIEEPSREQVDFDADPFEAMWDSVAEDDDEDDE
jgi:hypothetical protein